MLQQHADERSKVQNEVAPEVAPASEMDAEDYARSAVMVTG